VIFGVVVGSMLDVVCPVVDFQRKYETSSDCKKEVLLWALQFSSFSLAKFFDKMIKW
jgi:hypothetical protein